MFIPNFREDEPILTKIFFNGVVRNHQVTRSVLALDSGDFGPSIVGIYTSSGAPKTATITLSMGININSAQII